MINNKYAIYKIPIIGIESCDHTWILCSDGWSTLMDPPTIIRPRICITCGRVENLKLCNSDYYDKDDICIVRDNMIQKNWTYFLTILNKFEKIHELENLLENLLDNKNIYYKEEEVIMKYFQYFKMRLLNRLPEVKTVGNDFVLFNDGGSVLFDFVGIVDKLNNKNYKEEIHKCVLDIQKLRDDNINDTTYRRISDKLITELEGYYKTVKVYSTDENNIIHIDLLDGGVFERKYALNAFSYIDAMDAELDLICNKIKTTNTKFENVIDDIIIENREVLNDETLPSNVIKIEGDLPETILIPFCQVEGSVDPDMSVETTTTED